jgi:hypothetical protein
MALAVRQVLFGIEPRAGERLWSEVEEEQAAARLRLTAQVEGERARRDSLAAQVQRLEEALELYAELDRRLGRERDGADRTWLAARPSMQLADATAEERPGLRVIAGTKARFLPGGIGEEEALLPSPTVSVHRRAEPLPPPEPQAGAEPIFRHLEGKVVGADLRRVDGRLLAEKGMRITRSIVDEAIRHGVLAELVLGMRYPDELED